MRRTMAVGLLLAAMGAGAAGAEGAHLVTDFSGDLPKGVDDAVLSLRLRGARPLDDAQGDVVVQLVRRGGRWADQGHTAAADYNETSTNSVEIVEATLDKRAARGKLRIRIGPDGARRGRAHFPTPDDEFEVAFEAAVSASETLPWQEDREAFMPAWRKDVPEFGGRLVAGTWSGTWSWKGKSEARSGEVLGAVAPAPTPGAWGTEGNAVIEPAPGGGMRVTVRLAPKRVATGSAAWAVRVLDGPQDWTGFDAVRLVLEAPADRKDAAVAVGVKAAGGGVHALRSAALLRRGAREAVVALADLGTAWRAPDLARVEALRVGVENRRGVGDVAFTVRRIELVRRPELAAPKRDPAVTVRVDPDVALSLNGAAAVPKGLFGFHGGVSDKAPVPAAGRPAPLEYLRQLDPGYVRTITHTGFGGKPVSDDEIRAMQAARVAEPGEPDWRYKRAEAGDFVDNVVRCHTQDLWARPSWMDAGVEKAVEGVRAFYRREAARAWVPGDRYNLLRKLEVWNEPFMWGRHINMGWRNPPGARAWSDPTQYGYLPGRLGAEVWSQIFLAASEAAKAANPHVLLGGPSSPAFGDDDYHLFENYVARVLDACHNRLDFLTEHHYGGDPRKTAAEYEVATAYLDTRHGRRLPIYNTEANDLGASNAGRAAYNILDILTLIQVCPDKAAGRAMHGFGQDYLGNEGEEHAYLALAGLRGTIVSASASDPDVVTVAASPEEGRLVVFAFNNTPLDRRVELAVPEGFTPAAATALLADAPRHELQMRDVDGAFVPVPAEGKTVLRDLAVAAEAGRAPAADLPPRSAVRWVLRKDGYRPTTVRRTEQHFADAVIATVAPAKPLRAAVVWRGTIKGAKAAAVRLVTDNLGRGEGVMSVNGHDVPLPHGRDGLATDLPIDPSWLGTETVLEFRAADPASSNGFAVYAASVLLVR